MDTEFLSEQIVTLGTLLGAVATVPVLIEFLIDLRKRRKQVALSLDDGSVSELRVNLAGLDDLLEDISDLIDRARDPVAYESLKLGNEILILGPIQSGKKTLAHRIAQLADLDRVITVYNPRNVDALVRAKELIVRSSHDKILLLLPRMDLAFERDDDEELFSELEALIETSSQMSNVLVVGTAVYFEPDSALDNLFGVKLILPGYSPSDTALRPERPTEVTRMLAKVAEFYFKETIARGYHLSGFSFEDACRRVLAAASNPAEIEDIVVICQTGALYNSRAKNSRELLITPELLDRSIRRVIVNVVSNRGARSAA